MQRIEDRVQHWRIEGREGKNGKAVFNRVGNIFRDFGINVSIVAQSGAKNRGANDGEGRRGDDRGIVAWGQGRGSRVEERRCESALPCGRSGDVFAEFCEPGDGKVCVL